MGKLQKMNNDHSVQILKLSNNDLELFKEVILLFEEVFEMKNFKLSSSDHLSQLLEKDGFHVFTAILNDQVIGGLTVYVLDQYYSTKPLAYIFDLAIDTKLQRKGIGRKMINEVKDYFTKLGFEEVFVQADQDEDHAVNFYRATNPNEEEKVLHFYYTLER